MILFFRILLIVVGVIIAFIALINTLGDEWLNRIISREIGQLKAQARKHTIDKAKMETLEALHSFLPLTHQDFYGMPK